MNVLIKRVTLEMILYRKGLTNGEFASEIGVSENTLSYILNGKRKPSAKLAKKIVDSLNVEFDDIFELREVN
ncbi:helix-turn-helix transcriptional regulator [uncultured Vagococcus sp.]|uniref:helix-turn-helix transcriptional regulator n=1 Tax=uncultured Vagococcus sp. TaxID=189676 RepID=UPI0028D1A2D0|nr:helix-turn-helix transcriptional regulator [uncultured Vagococcus sp.]